MITEVDFAVEGKCVAITGGAGVLCGEMARQLAQRGAKIAILDYNLSGAEAVCGEIQAAGGSAVAVECNVLEKEAVDKSLGETVEKLGRVNVLINGAGGNKKEATCTPPETFFDLPADAIRWVFDLNCLGTILPSQVFGRHMAERGDGVVINLSSMNAFRPLTRIAAYSAAKAAISNFTQWLAVYMAQMHSTNIRVNAIAPGFFLTDQNRFLLTGQDGELTERGRQIIDHTPMGRFGRVDELIGTLLWLISDAAEFVTGIVVPVDGGFSAYSGV
ncbi:MAG: SDR family oxidoreductase [Phycisphaerae bacterium]|jgi:NAD(P)-dependent dehydrogenase (short-subunit alcohol dehydrogenase family)|nr:SDR family oxidoreductase [Phycisphaerae bacterium]